MSKSVNLQLPPALQQLVKQEISTGLYRNAEEVVLDALRCRFHQKFLDLRKEIELGVADIEAGRSAPLDIEGIKRKGRQLLNRRRKAG